MSRTKKKRVAPPKRIRRKEPLIFTLGPTLLKLVEADIAAQMEKDPVGYAAWLASLPDEEDATSVPSGGGCDDRAPA